MMSTHTHEENNFKYTKTERVEQTLGANNKFRIKKKKSSFGSWGTSHWLVHVSIRLMNCCCVQLDHKHQSVMWLLCACGLTDASTLPSFENSSLIQQLQSICLSWQKTPSKYHCTGFLYIWARKNLSDESFRLAAGFRVRTLPNTLESLAWRRCVRLPSQYLHSREPRGCRTFSAKSIKDKHIVMSLSWSMSLKPQALGAMSLKMTCAWPQGSSSCSLACVAGSVMSWLDRKWAPSRGGMCSRSMPITVPRGAFCSKMRENTERSIHSSFDTSASSHNKEADYINISLTIS